VQDRPENLHAWARRAPSNRALWEITSTEDQRPSVTVQLLFRGSDGLQVQARMFDEMVWKPALAAAGVIPAPTMLVGGADSSPSAEPGSTPLRHFYASVTLADGVNIKELAEYLGHHDPGFTLRLYTHLLPSSFDRARRAIDKRMLRRPRTRADGAGPLPAHQSLIDRTDSRRYR